MIGYTTELFLARQHGLFRLYRSDMSWQTVGEEEWVGCSALCGTKTQHEKFRDTCVTVSCFSHGASLDPEGRYQLG